MGLQLSGSVQLEGNLLVTGSTNSVFQNVLVSGTLTAQEIETQFVSASIIFSSGSNKFGDESGDKHQFTGSMLVTGSLAVAGAGTFSSLSVPSLTGPVTLTGNANSTSRFTITGADGNGASLFLSSLSANGKNWGIYSNGIAAVGEFAIYNSTNNINALNILPSGSATFSNTTSGTALTLYTSYASGRQLNFGFSDGSVLPTAAFYLGNQTAVGVFIGDETTTNGLYVKGNGNVGINNTDPGSKLEIKGATNDQIRIANDSPENSTTKLHIGQFGDGSYIFNNYMFIGSHTTDDASKGSAGFILDPSSIIFQTAPASATPSRVSRMTIASTGDGSVTINTGNLVIGTAGKGIDFSTATPDGTGTVTSELLDDYEEGTFTVTNAGDATGTVGTSTGEYTKIGNVVHFRIATNINTNFTSNAIGGLPFTIGGSGATSGVIGGIVVFNGNTSTLYGRLDAGGTNITFFSDLIVSSVIAPTTGMALLRMSGTYRV